MPRPFDLRRFTPPGMEVWPLLVTALLSLLFSILISLLTFAYRLTTALSALYVDRLAHSGLLREGAVMAPFIQVAGGALLPLLLSALTMLLFLPFYVQYYRLGSRSIYLMRRLPQRGPLARSLLLPVAAALLFLALSLLFALLYLLIYRLAVPAACLPLGLLG